MNFILKDESILENLKELTQQVSFDFNVQNISVELIQDNDLKLEFNAEKRTLKIHYTDSKNIYFLLNKAAKLNYNSSFNINFEKKINKLTFHIDLSRNNVLKVETIEKIIRILALLGYDAIGLYMEDTYEIKDEPYFGMYRGRMTVQELKEIDEYASKFGIEAIPYIQTLGHLERLFQHVHFWNILEGEDHLMLRNEKTYELIDKMFKTMREAFKTNNIHVGMDEVTTLGRLKFLDKFGYVDKKELLLEHLKRVKDIAKKYNFKIQIWSDMFSTSTSMHAYDSVDTHLFDFKIDDDIGLVYWRYEYLDKNEFSRIIKLHKSLTNNVSMAGGAWKWIGYAPNNSYSFDVIKNSFNASLENNLNEYILTGWGDNGGECSPFGILPSIYYLSELNYESIEKIDTFTELTGLTLKEFLNIDRLNQVHPKFDKSIINSFNRVFLYSDLLLGYYDQFIGDYQPKIYKNLAKTILKYKNSKFGYLFETLSYLASALSLKCEIALELRKNYLAKDKEALKEDVKKIKVLLKKIDKFKEYYKSYYLKESKINGLEVFDMKIGSLKERLLTTISRLNNYIEGNIENISELEEERLDFFGQGKNFIDNKNFNEPRFISLITKGVIY